MTGRAAEEKGQNGMRATGHRRKRGFTLAEMLLTVGIMVILAGISFVALTRYQRKLKLLEMDGTAEEIFMAAQNEMSILESNGTLEQLSGEALGMPFSAAETEDGAENGSHQYYALIHNAGDDGDSVGAELLACLLPFGAVDDTVRTGGNYRIEYDCTAKTVTAVYYSKTASFLSTARDAYAFRTDGSDADALRKAAGDKNLRQHFDGSAKEAAGGAIVGYYGGGSKAVPEGTLAAPVLSVENGARLLLHIRMPQENKDTETVLYVRGKDSGREALISLGDLAGVTGNTLAQTGFTAKGNAAEGKEISGSTFYMACPSVDAGADKDYLLCLDSVTEKDAHFAQLFPGLIPGEDIEIQALCSSTDGYALEVKSNTVTANSLFASVDTENITKLWTVEMNGMGSLKAGESLPVPVAMIASVRHLENLDPAVSGLSTAVSDADCIQAAVQTGDLVYAAAGPVTDYEGHAVQTPDAVSTADVFASDIAAYSAAGESSIKAYDLDGRAYDGYRPIQNAALLSYDGKGNAIVNLYSGSAANGGQGIFSCVAGQKDAKPVSIRDLRLVNCQFTNSEGAAAGALVGVAGDSHQLVLQGIEAVNCQLSSAGNVGGLVGAVEADGADSAAVRLYVNECGILGEYGSISGGNAGGLIGSLQGSSGTYLFNSTASVYVSGVHTAGGLLGELSGQSDIRFCYVGGHTRDGAYPEDSAEGAAAGQGRWNVQSDVGNAGGFIGEAKSVQLQLIGCYTTASVQSAGNAGAFLAAVSGGGSESASYCYAAGKVSGSCSLSEAVKNLAADGSDYEGTGYAETYDAALKTNNANPQYPYMTAAELYTAAVTDTAVPEISDGSRSLKYGSKHIGDFCPEENGTVEAVLRFLNGPRLYAEVFTPLKENETNYLTLVLTGTAENDLSKQTANTFQFEAAVAADHTVTLNRISSPNSSNKHIQDNQAKVITVADKSYLVYRILLDDISVPYMHFSDVTKGIRVGSAITGYATAEQNPGDGWYTDDAYLNQTVDTTWMSTLLTAANTELNLKGSAAVLEQYDWGTAVTAPFDTDNSLFGRDSDPFAADKLSVNISSCRHLQNLDQYVSGFEKNGGNRDKNMKATDIAAFRAAQTANLDWDQYIQAVGRTNSDFCLYKPSSEDSIPVNNGCFYGIQDLMLSEYDGQRHSISNLRVQGYKDDWNAAGLFAAVPENQKGMLTIRNLELRNVNSLANQKDKEGSAAALVGYYGSSQGLTVQNVVISGAEVNAKMDAGGLIGLARGSGSISMQNCAVYEGEKDSSGNRLYKLLISSEGGADNRSSTSDSASAGGLIGRIPSGTGLSVSISGCSVYGEKALILAKGIGKDSDHTDDSAGGLVGTILSGALNIDNCGVTAYVYAPYGDCTGGLVGDFSAGGSIRNSYAAGLTDASGAFTDEPAIDLTKLYTDTDDSITSGGYTVYGHLATGGLVGYIHRAVVIQNSFMTVSVSANVDKDYSYNASSQNRDNRTQKYFLGGLLGQLGAGSDGARAVNCYVAGRTADPSSGRRNLFTGAVLGYSMSNVNDYFYDASTGLTVYCLDGVSFTEGSSRFIGGQSGNILTRSQEKSYQYNADNSYGQGYGQTKIYGLRVITAEQMKQALSG